MITRASEGSMKRRLGFQKLNPRAPAPASTANKASSRLVMPQILISMLCLVFVLCAWFEILHVPRLRPLSGLLKQRTQDDFRFRRAHQRFTDQESFESCGLQLQ